jgi:hypothetical protein
MEKISKEETEKYLKSLKKVIYKKEIEELNKGESLKILKSEWEVMYKTTPRLFYLKAQKMRGIVDVKTFDDFYLVIKL